MKKILLFLVLFFTFTYVNAYPETFERTEENLRVSKDISVNSYIKNAILLTPSVDASVKVYDFANILENTDYTIEDLKRININAISGAFISPNEKAELKSKIMDYKESDLQK